MKDVIVEFAKVSGVALLSCAGLAFAFSVGYANGFRHGKADCAPTDECKYGRLVYCCDIDGICDFHREHGYGNDLPPVTPEETAASRKRFGTGWRPVGEEAAQ